MGIAEQQKDQPPPTGQPPAAASSSGAADGGEAWRQHLHEQLLAKRAEVLATQKKLELLVGTAGARDAVYDAARRRAQQPALIKVEEVCTRRR